MNLTDKHFSINCAGRLLTFEQVRIMGILNLTPNSFFDGGKYQQEKEIAQQIETMLLQGADIIDVGGMSSKPGAALISEAEELNRVLPTLQYIAKNYTNTIVSIDTVRAEVARQAVLNGASLVNDISAGNIDDKMFETVAQLQVPYIAMHMQGTPQNMQVNPQYQGDIVQEIIGFFVAKIKQLESLGVKDIIIDPGFGFGKTIVHNYQIMNDLSGFALLNKPLLVGVSRKSMIYKLLNTTPEEALNGTTVLHAVAIQKGAAILRVHDVLQAQQAITIMKQLNVK